MAATPEKITLQLRKMQEVDISEIAQIEQSSFPDPWPDKSFQDCLHLGYDCRVLEQNFVIQAYGIMVVENGDAHILNLCVRFELRRKGRGRIIMDHLLDLARVGGANTMFLEVRSSNLPAIQLYESMGFSQIGVRRGYYPGSEGGEDAIVMALHLFS